MKTSGIHHIVLHVKNVKKSKEFYTKVCDLKIIIDESDYFAMTDGKVTIFIGELKNKKDASKTFDENRIGIHHWAFNVDSLKKLKEIESSLRKNKVSMEENGITDDGYGGTAIFTQDPDGMKVEFHLNEE